MAVCPVRNGVTAQNGEQPIRLPNGLLYPRVEVEQRTHSGDEIGKNYVKSVWYRLSNHYNRFLDKNFEEPHNGQENPNRGAEINCIWYNSTLVKLGLFPDLLVMFYWSHFLKSIELEIITLGFYLFSLKSTTGLSTS